MNTAHIEQHSVSNTEYNTLISMIKDQVLSCKDPYVKSILITDVDFGLRNYNIEQIQRILNKACDQVMNEMGFRFKIDIQPECCLIKAHKVIDNNNDLFRMVERHNIERFRYGAISPNM